MKTILISIACVGLVLGVGAAFSQSAVEATEAAPPAQMDPLQFARGAKAWADTCARCHNMRDAKSLRDDQWRPAIAHMRVRAGLTGKEADDVLAFLQQSN